MVELRLYIKRRSSANILPYLNVLLFTFYTHTHTMLSKIKIIFWHFCSQTRMVSNCWGVCIRFIDENCFLCNNIVCKWHKVEQIVFHQQKIKYVYWLAVLFSVQFSAVHLFKKCHIHNGYSKVNGLKWTPSWSEECKCELI